MELYNCNSSGTSLHVQHYIDVQELGLWNWKFRHLLEYEAMSPSFVCRNYLKYGETLCNVWCDICKHFAWYVLLPCLQCCNNKDPVALCGYGRFEILPLIEQE